MVQFVTRYYDARLGRWVSTDPPLVKGEYLPKPSDFDSKHDKYWYTLNDKTNKLPGMGGVFNPVNLNAYQYAGNNPVVLVDPDGNYTLVVELPKDRNKTGHLTLYDDEGNKISSYYVLGHGIPTANNNFNPDSDRTKPDSNTPTGIFLISARLTNSKGTERHDDFGPVELILDGYYGEAKEAYDNGRSGIEVHAGKERGRRNWDSKSHGGSLSRTQGCLRMSEKDILDMNSKILQIEKKRKALTGQHKTIKDSVIVHER